MKVSPEPISCDFDPASITVAQAQQHIRDTVIPVGESEELDLAPEVLEQVRGPERPEVGESQRGGRTGPMSRFGRRGIGAHVGGATLPRSTPPAPGEQEGDRAYEDLAPEPPARSRILADHDQSVRREIEALYAATTGRELHHQMLDPIGARPETEVEDQLGLAEEVGPAIQTHAVHIRRGLDRADAGFDRVERTSAGHQSRHSRIQAGCCGATAKNDHVSSNSQTR